MLLVRSLVRLFMKVGLILCKINLKLIILRSSFRLYFMRVILVDETERNNFS